MACCAPGAETAQSLLTRQNIRSSLPVTLASRQFCGPCWLRGGAVLRVTLAARATCQADR
jgi:hypothetical protein